MTSLIWRRWHETQRQAFLTDIKSRRSINFLARKYGISHDAVARIKAELGFKSQANRRAEVPVVKHNELRSLWLDNVSFTEIAARLGVRPMAVQNTVADLKLPKRGPIVVPGLQVVERGFSAKAGLAEFDRRMRTAGRGYGPGWRP